MRSVKGLVILAVVALVAAPSFGAISLRVLVNGSANAELACGASATVSIEANCDANAGVAGSGGTIYADASGMVTVSGSVVLNTAVFPGAMPGFIDNEPGSAGPDGGWLGVGVAQSMLVQDPTVGNGVWVELANYQVVVDDPCEWCTYITLTPVANDNGVGGSIGNVVIDTNLDTAIGAMVPAVVHLVPEPATLALLALGGLAAVRRRK